jgi:hypothetical protein
MAVSQGYRIGRRWFDVKGKIFKYCNSSPASVMYRTDFQPSMARERTKSELVSPPKYFHAAVIPLPLVAGKTPLPTVRFRRPARRPTASRYPYLPNSHCETRLLRLWRGQGPALKRYQT